MDRNTIKTAYECHKDELLTYAESLCESQTAEGYAIRAYCLLRDNGAGDKNIERYLFKAAYLEPDNDLVAYVGEEVRFALR